jgi:hypothetical protein
MVGIAWGMQAGVSSAAADWWDHLSGPGPFRGTYLEARFLCVSNSADQGKRKPGLESTILREGTVYSTWVRPWERTGSALALLNPPHISDRQQALDGNTVLDLPQRRKAQARLDCESDQRLRGYFMFIYRRLVSLNNDLVSAEDTKVHIRAYDVAYFARLNRALDFGVALGLNHFEGAAFRTFDRISVTPSLSYALFGTGGYGPRTHALKVEASARVFLRDFKAQDFCNQGRATCTDPTWRSGIDIVPMVRFVIDPSVFLF